MDNEAPSQVSRDLNAWIGQRQDNNICGVTEIDNAWQKGREIELRATPCVALARMLHLNMQTSPFASQQ